MSRESASITHIDNATGGIECIAASYKAHRFFPHFHDHYVIGVVTEGAAVTYYRGETHVVRAGSVFVIEPGEVHDGAPLNGGGYSYRAFHPTPEQLGAEFLDERTRPRFNSLAYEEPELAARMAAIHERTTTTGSSSAEVVALFVEIAALYASSEARAETPVHRGVRLAREHVDANYARRVALSDLSALSGMSAFHLIRTFRREIGLPPGMYLQVVRIRRASEMLRAGEPISRVAYAAGFSDQSHLTRRFRRIMGVTPGAYARGAA